MIGRFFLCIVLLAAFLAAGYGAMRGNKAGITAWTSRAQEWLSGNDNSYREARFRVDLVDRLNYPRIASKKPALMVDLELESWLATNYASMDTDDLDHLTKQIQEALPRYFRISVCTAAGPSLRLLLDEFQDYSNKTPTTMTHMGLALRPTAGGLAQQALLIVGQRLQDFSPEILTQSTDEAYYSQCPHCKHPHVVRISRQQRSMGLECPQCRRTYAVIAADTHGQFRYVNEFLTGYAPPAIFAKDQSRVHELFTIWSAVHSNCVYTLDPGTKKDQTDSWQTSLETQQKGKGDCEDSAIFLCDWLLSRGFQARVALGRYGDMGGHAWCVVKLDDKEYLLESTEGRPDIANPPLVSRVGSRYVPEVMFDRFAIYVRSDPAQPWKGDYWSSKAWFRIEPRAMLGTGSGLVVQKARVAEAELTDPSRLARTNEQSPAAAPFLEIGGIPRGSDVWRVALPSTAGLVPTAPSP